MKPQFRNPNQRVRSPCVSFVIRISSLQGRGGPAVAGWRWLRWDPRAEVHGRGRENAVGRGVTGEVEEFQDVGAETQEFGTAALAGPIEGDADGPFDSARAGGHDDDA